MEARFMIKTGMGCHHRGLQQFFWHSHVEKKEKRERSPSVENADGSPPVKSEKKKKKKEKGSEKKSKKADSE
eukprot:1137998-Pelagomonas_calceolata.AAC.11